MGTTMPRLRRPRWQAPHLHVEQVPSAFLGAAGSSRWSNKGPLLLPGNMCTASANCEFRYRSRPARGSQMGGYRLNVLLGFRSFLARCNGDGLFHFGPRSFLQGRSRDCASSVSDHFVRHQLERSHRSPLSCSLSCAFSRELGLLGKLSYALLSYFPKYRKHH